MRRLSIFIAAVAVLSLSLTHQWAAETAELAFISPAVVARFYKNRRRAYQRNPKNERTATTTTTSPTK
jgi:hypothetical protein